MSDELDAAIRAYLGVRPSAARRQELALLLRAEAERQERIAAAAERDTRRPAQQRIAGRRGGRPSSPWIRIVRRARVRALADEIMIRLSESLYTLAGRPARLDVQRIDGSLYLIPADGDAGYKVLANSSAIFINASGARDILPGDGRYDATLQAGRIRVGSWLEA